VIDESVEKLILEFQQRTKRVLSLSPTYQLDSTWPTFGVVDLMCFGLRGKDEFEKVEEDFLSGAASYIGAITHECWSKIADKVTLYREDDDVVIKAEGGPALPGGQEFTVRLKTQLKRLLRDAPQSMPVVADFVREGGLEYNYLSIFGIGLTTGLFPFGDGPWASRLEDSFQSEIEKVTKELAVSSAAHYGRVYPDEQLGQVAELYLQKLIFPPTLMKEEWPVLDAARGIVNFSKEYNVQHKALTKLAHNLALSPDERISMAGLCVYGAICDGSPDPEIVAVAERRGTYMGLLRYTMVQIAKDLKLAPDWTAVDDLTSQNVGRYQVEVLLGFIPWLKMPFGRLQQRSSWESTRQLLECLIYFDIENARKICEQVINKDPSEVEFRVQLSYLAMVDREYETARSTLKQTVTEPGGERNPMLYNLWGLCDLLLDDVDSGVRHLRTAYQLGSVSPNERYQFTNNYGWALILAEQFEQALGVLDLAISGSPCALTSLLNKKFVLNELKRDEEAEAVQSELVKLAPLDVRVFGGLLNA